MKPENLLRHLNETHPRHPEVPALAEKLRKERRTAAPRTARLPVRLRRWQIVLAVGLAAIAIGAYVAAPYFDPNRNFGIDSCIEHTAIPSEIPYHMHPALSIVILGNTQPIPANIGISSSCMHPVHTHTQSDPTTGIVTIHVETPVLHAFYLHDFFYVWNQPFNQNQILDRQADATNHVRMTVNGTPSSAYEGLTLYDGQQIQITYGP